MQEADGSGAGLDAADGVRGRLAGDGEGRVVAELELRPLRVVEASGSPLARGRQIGEQLRDEVQDGLQRWKEAVARRVASSFEEYLEMWLAATNFVPAIMRWCPDLHAEVEGVAQGGCVDPRELMAFQWQDEEWWFWCGRRPSPKGLGRACTAMGFRDGPHGGALLAQNMDVPAYLDGGQVLLRIHDDDGMSILVYTVAGLIALNGLNSAGVGVCCNTLMQLQPDAGGLPVAFVVRSVLTMRSVGAVRDFLSGIQHASGQNYMVGDPRNVADFECSAGGVTELLAGSAVVCHTNHPLASKDLRQGLNPRALTPATSEERLRCVERAVVDRHRPFGVEAIKETLSDTSVPVCLCGDASGSGSITIGCLVLELSKKSRLHVAPGPPVMTPFAVVDV